MVQSGPQTGGDTPVSCPGPRDPELGLCYFVCTERGLGVLSDDLVLGATKAVSGPAYSRLKLLYALIYLHRLRGSLSLRRVWIISINCQRGGSYLLRKLTAKVYQIPWPQGVEEFFPNSFCTCHLVYIPLWAYLFITMY